jgi:signal transduction histidine kinase
MGGIEHMMHYLMVMNPHIEIYLLDSTGSIIAFFAVPDEKVQRESVHLEPLKKFIDADEPVSILGDDPRNPERLKPFSAAPIRIMNRINGYIYVILGGEQYDNASQEIKKGFLMSTAARGLLVSLLFTAIIGLVLFFFMTRRLHAVRNVVIGFKEGDYHKRLPEKSDDDFGQLSRAFNQMADTIVGNMDELKRTDDLRRELVANVSHDLRSPLASIQGYLETIMLKMESLSPEELKGFVQISLDNVNKLGRLVAELFELSKLDAHQIEPKQEIFSVSELVQDIAMKYKPEVEEKGIDIKTELDQNLPMARGDIGMIERVLTNLIENAIRYTPEHGAVLIQSRRENGSVRVKVADSGPGIPETDLPHIFDRFYHGRGGGIRGESGAGLGLAIAKKILELHGSDIKVETGPNMGTSFYFDLATLQQKLPTI